RERHRGSLPRAARLVQEAAIGALRHKSAPLALWQGRPRRIAGANVQPVILRREHAATWLHASLEGWSAEMVPLAPLRAAVPCHPSRLAREERALAPQDDVLRI